MMNAPKQLPVNAMIVLEMIMVLSWASGGKNPALKDGQNIQRNKVPIIAKVTEVEFCYTLASGPGLFMIPRIKLAPSPK